MTRKRADLDRGPGQLSRRDALAIIGGGAVTAAASALGAGCSSPSPGDELDAMDPGQGGDLGPSPDLMPEPMLTREQLLASVDTIVVLMMENRSFDHYLGRLRSDVSYGARAVVDGLRGTESNPDPNGAPVLTFPLTTYEAKDPPHGWDDCHAQWNNGKNDGFVKAHAGQYQSQVMGYYERATLPFYYALADRFTVCDRWFSSVMGPTWPNRFYLHSTTSQGKKDNTPFVTGGPATVWERLKAKKLRGKNYADGVAFYTGGYLGKVLTGNSPVTSLDDFFKDAKAGTLPEFSIIDPDFLKNDDHPAHDIRLGQALMSSLLAALFASPQWSRSLFVITYDEHGGFFDHVPPPTTIDVDPPFTQLGFRVPTLVIGPTVRSGHVNSNFLEHVSVAATLGVRYGIDNLSARMEHTIKIGADLSSCIDPRLVGKPQPPPTDLPKVVMSARDLMQAARSTVTSQPELSRLVASGAIPKSAMDPRSAEERFKSWLLHAQELDVLRIR